MSNNIYLWCKDKVNDDKICDQFKENNNNYELIDFLVDNMPNNEADIQNDIIQKRKTITNLKKMRYEDNFLANKRNYFNFIKIDQKIKQELIYLIILLILAICFGLYCIYYYFLIK